jgi:hypothetical protein
MREIERARKVMRQVGDVGEAVERSRHPDHLAALLDNLELLLPTGPRRIQRVAIPGPVESSQSAHHRKERACRRHAHRISFGLVEGQRRQQLRAAGLHITVFLGVLAKQRQRLGLHRSIAIRRRPAQARVQQRCGIGKLAPPQHETCRRQHRLNQERLRNAITMGEGPM